MGKRETTTEAQGTRPHAERSAAPGLTAGSVPREKIAARAYQLWLASGMAHGKDQEHWYQAERELRMSR